MNPLLIEFTGTPEAGKTSCIVSIFEYFKDIYNVAFIREAAESLPQNIKKGSFEASYWMTSKTIKDLEMAFSRKPDIILIDRGIVDSLFYGQKLINSERTNMYKYFSLIDHNLHFIPDVLFLFTCTANEVLRRKGGEGRIVNREYIENYNQKLNEFYIQFNNYNTNIIIKNTTNINKSDLLRFALDNITTSHHIN